MGPEKASRPNRGKSPHTGDSQDVVFSRNQVIFKKNWWFDCTLRPKRGYTYNSFKDHSSVRKVFISTQFQPFQLCTCVD